MAKHKTPGRPPAMTDVAALAGVSHQTVSRVINDKGTVRPETRERVLSAIAQLGYRPNEAARALVTRRSRLIGIITTQFVNYGPASTLLGVQLAAKQAGFYVSVASLSEFSQETLHDAVDLFLGQGVAGIVLIAPVIEVAHELHRLPLPPATVVISSAWTEDSPQVSRVGVDQRAGARRAVRYLVEQGCKSVVHFAGPENWFDAEQRREGWLDALAEAKLEPSLEFSGDWSASSGYRMAQELLSAELPDAIFVANDQMSLGALRALGEAGVRVPEDLLVVGFDDEPGSEFFRPALTTVRQDFESVGTSAVELITQRLDGREVADRIIQPELILRHSA